jgi:hypothetical protein
VVAAVGLRSESRLVEGLKDTPFPIHVIGDCVAPRKIKNAIWEAFRLAYRI